jgi:hypothetical protein
VKLRAAIIVSFLISCGRSSPTATVQALVAAASEGQRQKVYELVGPQTRKKLTEAAEQAARSSGRRQLDPWEMLAVGWFVPAYRIENLRVTEESADRATVDIEGTTGEHQSVVCVREGGYWKVELP